MPYSMTVVAEAEFARWASSAHYLQQVGLHCRMAKGQDGGFSEMLSVLHERVDKHGLEAVLRSCACAFLSFQALHD